MGWWYRDRFPKSRPRAAKGGIKAQSGKFGQSWWSQRWIAVLESFSIGGRLQRGRSYARSGQVLSIDVAKGRVHAKVQGSRPTPYGITIEVQHLTPAEWSKLVKSLSQQAIFAAKLLAGEMPQEIEAVFSGAGLSLFPKKLNDLTTNCSCPDYSNPCKHIAAVYYLLGEEFDRDPFLLFQLRGLTREELLDKLGGGPVDAPTGASAIKSKKGKAAAVGKSAAVDRDDSGGADIAPANSGAGVALAQRKGKGKTGRLRATDAPPVAESQPHKPETEPLPGDVAAFWNVGTLPNDLFSDAAVAPVAAALPKRLGHFPFWRGHVRFLDAIEPLYRSASRRGMQVFIGERPTGTMPAAVKTGGGRLRARA